MLPVRLTCRSPLTRRVPDSFFDAFEPLGAWLDRPSRSMSLDVREQDDSYVIEADVPGIGPDDLEITVEDGVLTLATKERAEAEHERTTYHVRERRYGSVSRSIWLTADSDTESIKASLQNGVIVVTLAKHEALKPRKIDVQAE